MSRSFLRFAGFPVLLCLASGGFGPASAQEAAVRHGRPIVFPEPKGSVAGESAGLPSPAGRTLKDLEADLKRPFDALRTDNSRNSLEAAPIQVPPPVLVSKRVKQLLEKQKDWVFSAPDDLVPGTTAEDFFKVDYDANGQEKRNQSAIEGYLDRQTRARGGPTNQGNGEDLTGVPGEPDGLTSSDAQRPFAGQRDETGPSLKRLSDDYKKSPFHEAASSRGLSDIFGFGSMGAPEGIADRMRAQQERINAFKQLLGSGGSPSPVGAGPIQNPFEGSSATALPSLPSVGSGALPGGVRSPLNPFPGAAGMPLQPAGQPQGAANPGASLAPALPGASASRSVLTEPPQFSIPKRAF